MSAFFLCANWICNLLVIWNVNESIINCVLLNYLAYRIRSLSYSWCYFFLNASYGFRRWGTLIDIMMPNSLDWVQTVGRWHTSDLELSLVKFKKNVCNVTALLCIWLDGQLETTSKDCSLFDKILLIGSNIFRIRFSPLHHWLSILLLHSSKGSETMKKVTMNLSIDRFWWWCGCLSYSAGRPACCLLFGHVTHIECIINFELVKQHINRAAQVVRTKWRSDLDNSIRDFFPSLLLLNRCHLQYIFTLILFLYTLCIRGDHSVVIAYTHNKTELDCR